VAPRDKSDKTDTLAEGDFILSPSSTQARSFLLSDLFCLLGVAACSLVGFAQITKYFHGTRQLLIAVAIVLCVALAMLWLRWKQLKPDNDLPALWIAVPWCLFTLLFAVLFPIAHRHTLGVGSDRGDALRVSASALLHGHYPYYATTYLGNAITPLPGAILLAAPFFLLGNVSLENLFWLALFLWFSYSFFRGHSTAIIYVLLLLATSASNLDDFVVGGDYVANAMYVCVAVALVLVTHRDKISLWQPIAAEILLGLAVDSRPIYVVAISLVFAYLLQHEKRSVAIRALLVSGSVAALISIPFYLYDPAHFAPLHIEHKLDFIPAQYHASLVMPALGLLASCSGFFVRLSRQRLYLLIGVSLFFMVGLAGIISWCVSPFTLWGWYGLDVLVSPALFISLWIFSKYEATGYSLRRERFAEGVSALS
jgi:hypothetical protein